MRATGGWRRQQEVAGEDEQIGGADADEREAAQNVELHDALTRRTRRRGAHLLLQGFTSTARVLLFPLLAIDGRDLQRLNRALIQTARIDAVASGCERGT